VAQYRHHEDSKYPHEVLIPHHAVYEYDDDFYRLTPEALQWLIEMVEMPYKIKYAYWDGVHRIFFVSKQDAVKFKLAWS
jgi:hypothetical protein